MISRHLRQYIRRAFWLQPCHMTWAKEIIVISSLQILPSFQWTQHNHANFNSFWVTNDFFQSAAAAITSSFEFLQESYSTSSFEFLQESAMIRGSSIDNQVKLYGIIHGQAFWATIICYMYMEIAQNYIECLKETLISYKVLWLL